MAQKTLPSYILRNCMLWADRQSKLGQIGDITPPVGAIFMRAKEWGVSIRELNDAIKENPIAKFFAEMSGYGFQLFAWGMGISMLAGTIRKLAAALFLLSGASTALSILKTIGTLSEFPGLGGADSKKVPPKSSKGTGGVPDVVPWFNSAAHWIKGFGSQSLFGLGVQGLGDTPGDTFEDQVKNQQKYKDGLRKLFGLNTGEDGVSGWDRFWFGDAAKPDFSFRDHAGISTGRQSTATGASSAPASGDIKPVRIDASSISELKTPQGTQDVRVTNQQPFNIVVNANITNNGVGDPKAAADATLNELGSQVKSAVEGVLSD